MESAIKINNRKIGTLYSPFVIAEIGINHEGSIRKAFKMVDDAHKSGCECVKFQTHIIEDEMIKTNVKPGHTKETIWDIMKRCALSENEDIRLKKYVESKGMIYLSTPFSRAAANLLHRLKVPAYKIGSGECNNYPLIEHVARFGKPVILSTGMNDIPAIRKSVNIFKKYKISYALLHCTSVYPTPYEKVRLGAINNLKHNFPDCVIGLSDHSIGTYTCYAAVALGASIIEKHFTSKKSWKGPDINISITPKELEELIIGARAIHQALGGTKTILPEEYPTINFAYACVVSIKKIKKGEKFNENNIWVKRPGTGEIKAINYPKVLGNKSNRDIINNTQIKWSDIR